MKQSILIPVLLPQTDRTPTNFGGTASASKRVRESAADHVKQLTVDAVALDAAIEAAASMLERSSTNLGKPRAIAVESMRVRLGVSAGGSVGFLGTGVDAKAEMSFEITLKVAVD